MQKIRDAKQRLTLPPSERIVMTDIGGALQFEPDVGMAFRMHRGDTLKLTWNDLVMDLRVRHVDDEVESTVTCDRMLRRLHDHGHSDVTRDEMVELVRIVNGVDDEWPD